MTRSFYLETITASISHSVALRYTVPTSPESTRRCGTSFWLAPIMMSTEVLDNAVLTADDGQRYSLYHSQDLWAIPEGAEIPEGF